MSNEQQIWDLLIAEIKNPMGVAAVMGNLRAESSMNPLCMTGTNAKQWITKQAYVDAVDNGSYDRYSFSHDNIAFGLVQWRYWSRKEALYDFAQHSGYSIGALNIQVEYLLHELPKYKTVWNGVCNATNIDDACDLVMLKYEQPGTTTDTAKQKRRNFAHEYYDKYAKPAPDPQKKVKKVRTTAPKVFIRAGNGKNYAPIGRIPEEGKIFNWVATADNGWHAIETMDRVYWISGDFSEVFEE